MSEFRSKYVEQNPGASPPDVARAAGAAWRALPDAEKKVSRSSIVARQVFEAYFIGIRRCVS